MNQTPRKALALISGGLDSMLAAKVIQDQGVVVEGINFYTGFCVEGHTHAIRRQDQVKPKRNNALWVAEQLGIKLHIVDVVEEYKNVLLNPKHGYGANLNPCLDCKIFMVSKALDFIRSHGLDFVITGEVVGQRPNSQLKHKMLHLNKATGNSELLLRPLSAKILPETLPEREGWVNRENLYDFNGRTRKPQMELAAHYGFTDYAQPAGGCCFLTDASYSAKLVDMWQHRPSRDYELDDIILLKVGRHLRPAPNYKLIVGREEGENNFMEGYRKQFICLRPLDVEGPLVLCDGAPDDADLEQAARIAARFSQGKNAEQVSIEVKRPDAEPYVLQIKPMPVEEIPQAWYV